MRARHAIAPPARHHGGRARRAGGFTLVEVLVALGIVALALTAGMRASASLTRNAERQTQQLLARLCAENALVNMRLAKQMPAIGDSVSTCEQGARRFGLRLAVRPTPNSNFLRVDAQVLDGEAQIYSLATVVGRY